MRTPHVPAAVAAGLEGSTCLKQVPTRRAIGAAVPCPRRETLQAYATAGRKVLRPGTSHELPQAEDAPSRRIAATALAAVQGPAHSGLVSAKRCERDSLIALASLGGVYGC